MENEVIGTENVVEEEVAMTDISVPAEQEAAKPEASEDAELEKAIALLAGAGIGALGTVVVTKIKEPIKQRIAEHKKLSETEQKAKELKAIAEKEYQDKVAAIDKELGLEKPKKPEKKPLFKKKVKEEKKEA